MFIKNSIIRLLFIAFCSFSLITLMSCDLFGGGNSNQPKPLVKAPPAKQIYTVPETEVADFDTLDPALAHDIHSISAIQMIFTGLVAVDDKLRVRPQLATSWEQSASGTIWTFHLKPHLTFSDGTPLTSADVAYSIDRALQPATQSTIAPLYLGLIKDSDQLLAGRITTLINDSLLIPNANTLVILTKKKAAYFLPMLTYTCSYVVEKRLVTLYGTKFTEHLAEGGGAGPFKVAQYIHRQVIDFVPNANYYDAKPQLQKVRFVFYRSTDETYLAYQRSQVDMTGVPLTTLSKDKQRKDFFEIPQLWINYYTMNYLVKPFDNIHIRQAFALAIDKTAIANTAWLGTVLPTNHIVPQGMDGYNPKLTGPDGTENLTGNAKEAQQLLQQGLREEQWSDVSQMPAITLTYAAGFPAFDKEVAMMVAMWQKALKVAVVPFPIDYNTLLDKVTAATNNPDGLQFWGLAWVGEYADPQDWLTLQFDKGVPNNNMNYGQNTSTTAALQLPVQRQLETADATMQADVRLQMYQQAEQQLVNDVAWMPMEQVTTVFLRTPFIVGIVDNAQGSIPPDDWATIYRVQ